MWEGWEKNADRDTYKSYELLVKADVTVSLLATFIRINSEPILWGVEIVAFNPLAGEYTLYQDVFSNLVEAEIKTWEKAQDIARIYRQPTKPSLSMGRAVPPPAKRKKKSPIPLKWKDWYQVTDTERIKSYSLRVETKDRLVDVRAAVYLPNTNLVVPSWIVIITAHTISEGSSATIFQGIYPEFIEAEKKAWEEAQKAVDALRQKAA
jgi:hypothetical protein